MSNSIKLNGEILEIKNATDEHTDGGCETKIQFKDHNDKSLAQIQGSHDGTSDDNKGDLILSTNDGSNLNTVLTLDSNKNATFTGTVTYSKLHDGTTELSSTIAELNIL